MRYLTSLLLGAAYIAVRVVGMTSAGRNGHGFIGYGIIMYKPTCCHACRDSISSSHLTCSPAMDMEGMEGMDMSMDAETEPECYATDDAFLQTLAYCISSKCPRNMPMWRLEKWWKENAVGRAGHQPDPKASYQQTLANITSMPTETLVSGDPLNKTSLVSDEDWLANYNAMSIFEMAEITQERYGLVLLLSGVIIPIVFSFLRYLPLPSVLQSKFYAWLIDPPVFGSKHSTPSFWNLFLVPTRGQALFISYLIVINVVLCAVNIHTNEPNAWYPDDDWGQIVGLLTNRFGLLSFANMPLLFLYAGRNNLLLWVTNWSHSTFILLHRWIAAIATLQAVLHSILWLRIYAVQGGLLAEQRQPYWYWGAIATLGMAVLIPCSILPVRQKFYELFLAWHVIISILVVVGCYYHIIFRFQHQWGYETWLYVVMAVWGFDRILRILRLARNGVKRATVKILDDDYVRVDIEGVSGNGHAYLYFPTLTWRVWENHPFSVASTVLPIANRTTSKASAADSDVEKNLNVKSSRASDSEDSSSQLSSHQPHKTALTFLLRTQSGLTQHLRKHGSLPVLVEGSYGSHTDLSEYPTMIAIAGGVGITAVLPLLRAHTGRTKLYWGARSSGLIEEFTGSLVGVDKETFVGKRMSVPHVLESELKGETEKVVVLVSGPHSMADEVRDVVGRLGRTESVAVKLVEESFSW